MPITLILADDHQMLRSGLRNLFDQQKDLKVLGEADNGRAAVAMVRELNPNLVIMDITMPELNGIEATRQIASESNGTRVITVSAHSDRQFVSDALKAGAMGYLPKSAPFDELLTAVRTVATGRVYLSPRVANLIVEEYVQGGTPDPSAISSYSKLSNREREVLQLLAEGQSTKEMARSLHLSVKTVETHRAKIMNRLNLFSVAELTKYAIRKGLTSVET